METNDGRKVLLGLSHDELKAEVRDLGMPSFTAGQILKWLYQQHVVSIDEMTNISKANRERLKEHFVVARWLPSTANTPATARSSTCSLSVVMA